MPVLPALTGGRIATGWLIVEDLLTVVDLFSAVPDTNLRWMTVSANGVAAGSTLADLQLRAKTGAQAVALRRDDEIEFAIEADMSLCAATYSAWRGRRRKSRRRWRCWAAAVDDRHSRCVARRHSIWLKCRISSDLNAWISTSQFRQRWCEGVGTPARNARWRHERVSAADICRFYKRAYSSISSVTGQWSLPKMSLRMPVARTRSAIESLTRK